MKRGRRFILSLMAVGLLTSPAWSVPVSQSVVRRDPTYEENLRWQASADQTITPGRVFRWMLGMRGASVFASSAPEFQPIVNANNSNVRVVATIAFKF